METYNQNQINETKSSGMELLNESLYSLNETVKWTKIIAIIGFIFIGLSVIIGFFMGIMMIISLGIFVLFFIIFSGGGLLLGLSGGYF